MINVEKLKDKLRSIGKNVEWLGIKSDIERSTMYRKLANNGENATISDINKWVIILNLTLEEALDIFLINGGENAAIHKSK